jgi:pimeloyl-ACP methyl ester carboxylesterase
VTRTPHGSTEPGAAGSEAAERLPATQCWSACSGRSENPLVVLVHGSMDRSAGLLRLSRRLDDRYRVLRYDRRGYGRSAAVGPPYGVAEHVDDLATLLSEAGARPGAPAALVFGHSFGGDVALGLASRRPELVEAVVVYEAPLPWLDWWPGHTAGPSTVDGDGPEDAAERFMRRLLGDRKWERLPSATRAARRAEGAAMVDELDDLARAAPWSPEHVRLPVLALRGERARAHHRRAMDLLADVLPSCRVEIVPGAGHVGPNTAPDAVAHRVVSFVERVRDRSTAG